MVIKCGFFTPLDIRAYFLDEEFVVLSPLRFYTEDGFQLTVERGFITNFASVPKSLQAIPGLGVNGASRWAAVLHDRLYCSQGVIQAVEAHSQRTYNMEYTREQCDDIFRQALLSCGSNVAQLMYLGVRLGGNAYWQKRRDGLQRPDFVPDDYWVDPAYNKTTETTT